MQKQLSYVVFVSLLNCPTQIINHSIEYLVSGISTAFNPICMQRGDWTIENKSIISHRLFGVA